jgi:hypothetical protein
VVADVPPSEIVAPIANAEDGDEGGDDGVCHPGSAEDSHMEGRGGGHRDCSQEERGEQRHRTTMYSVILIVGGMMVAAAVARLPASPLCR